MILVVSTPSQQQNKQWCLFVFFFSDTPSNISIQELKNMLFYCDDVSSQQQNSNKARDARIEFKNNGILVFRLEFLVLLLMYMTL